jgi:hypothetical protein
MTENAGNSEPQLASTSGLPVWAAVAAIGFILFGYAIFTYKILEMTANEVAWERALLIYRGVEALAFAAAGVALGVQIQRGQVQAAKTELTQASAEMEKKSRAVKDMVAKTVTIPSSGGLEAAVLQNNLQNNDTALKNLKTAIDAIL